MKYQSRIMWIMSLVLLTQSALVAAQATPPAPEGPSEGDRALAERFVALAQESLRQGHTGRPVYEEAAALLQAATRLNPGEPRHWRLLVEALAAVGDNKPTQDALTSLVLLNPSNPSVYVQLMNLYLADMETVDAKLAYLLGDVQKPGVIKRGELPAQVRSAAGAIAAQLSLEQGATEQARLLVARALELNAVNPVAAELNWMLLQDSEDEVARTEAILRLVQAQPGQVQHLAALARQLARAGFLDDSLTWFGLAAGLGQQMGTLDPQELIPDWAAAMFVTNNPFDADNLVDQLLATNPNDIDGWFMRLLLDRNSGDRQALSDSTAAARAVLLRQLHAVRAEAGLIPGDAAANETNVPDLSGDLQALQSEDTPAEARAAYASAVHDLLWLELYFQGPSDTTARLLEVLRTTLQPDSVPLARLEGWSFLLQNKPDEARVKLSAVADRDPLAALGLLRMVNRNDDDAMRKMTDEGRKLLSDNPSGLVGAFVASELRPFGVRAELPDSSRSIARRVDDFTRDWPLIYSDPHSFYQIRARVVGVAHPVGRPMIAEIEVKNVSGFDLSIDERGVIQPTLWFDARLSGVINQQLSGIAVDRLMQGLVLPARQTLVQHVRLDQNDLSAVLLQYPQISIQIMFSVLTNPMTVQNEEGEAFVVPGAVGQRREFQNLIERVAMPVQKLEREVTEAFRQDDVPATLNAIDLVRAYLPVLGEFATNAESQGGDAEQVAALRQLGPQLRQAVSRKMQDLSRPVRAWAAFTVARLTSGDEQAEILRQMRSSDDWPTRLLSLVALRSRPPEEIKDLAGRLTGENEDLLVRRLAEATIAVAELPPATQPSEPADTTTVPLQ